MYSVACVKLKKSTRIE